LALTLVAHLFGGGPEIHQPILASDLDPYLKAMASVIRHMATFTMVGGLGVLVVVTTGRGACISALWLIVAQFVAFTGVFLYYGVVRFGTLLEMPQWIAFGLLALFIVTGLRTGHRKGAR
jgi:hypothetical protein